MADYKKIKCIICGYEMVSQSESPRCSKCGSRRFNQIDEFTAIREPKMAKKAENKKPEAKPAEQKKAPKQDDETPKKTFFDDVDEDIWGD